MDSGCRGSRPISGWVSVSLDTGLALLCKQQCLKPGPAPWIGPTVGPRRVTPPASTWEFSGACLFFCRLSPSSHRKAYSRGFGRRRRLALGKGAGEKSFTHPDFQAAHSLLSGLWCLRRVCCDQGWYGTARASQSMNWGLGS